MSIITGDERQGAMSPHSDTLILPVGHTMHVLREDSRRQDS